MASLLTYVETQDGRPKRSSLEVVSRCRAIADERGDDLAAALISSEPQVAADDLARFGVRAVYVVDDARFVPAAERSVGGQSVPYPPITTALAGVVAHVSPSLVAMPSSESVKEVLGALAVRLDAPALSDVSSFELRDDAVEAVRPVLAGKFNARVRAEGSPVLVSVRAGSYAASEREASKHVTSVDIHRVDVGVGEDVGEDAGEASVGRWLREIESSGGTAVDLSEARVVVAAGRGVRDEEGKRLVEELASALGAAIGSSRAVVEAGLFDAGTQIGQTGKVVSPDLYIALGISGAIQHVAGMTNSRVIVAVNRDPDAPIFRYATYGIVGDLYDVVPKLIEAVRQR